MIYSQIRNFETVKLMNFTRIILYVNLLKKELRKII